MLFGWRIFWLFIFNANISFLKPEDSRSEEADDDMSRLRVPRAISGSCAAGWTSVGSYCYFMPTNYTTSNFDTYLTLCSQANGVLPTFPLQQDYTDFLNYWLTFPTRRFLLMGYKHLVGKASNSDMVSFYDDQQVNWQTPFPPTYINFNPTSEWCSFLCQGKGSPTPGIGDITCKPFSVATYAVCQQRPMYDVSTTKNATCSPLCESQTTTAGHRYTTSYQSCDKNANVLNATVAYAMTEYIPGISETIYEMASTKDTLMVYGQQGLNSLSSLYSIKSVFFVSTVKTANMQEFALMVNGQNNDSMICQVDSAECSNLASQSWTQQQTFYLFTKMDNYNCSFCEWTAWQVLSPCNATICGYRNETRIRYESCFNIQSGINETISTACPVVTPCKSHCGSSWLISSKVCGSAETMVCRTSVCTFQQKTCGQVIARDPGVVQIALSTSSVEICGDKCSENSWCDGLNYQSSNVTSSNNCELIIISMSSITQPYVCDAGWNFYLKL